MAILRAGYYSFSGLKECYTLKVTVLIAFNEQQEEN